jgi:hypothetical protein
MAGVGFVAGSILSEAGDVYTVQRNSDSETVQVPAENAQKMNPPKYNKVRAVA